MIGFSRQCRVQVRVMNGAIHAAFNTSSPPMLWHFDMKQNPSFGLLLKPQGDGWNLCVAVRPEETVTVAHFGVRDDADEAYSALRKAVMGCAWSRLRVRWVVALVVVLLALWAGSNLIGGRTIDEQVQHKMSVMENGMPMSADDFLKQSR